MENASHAFADAVRKSMRQIRSVIGAATINPDLLTSAERIQYEGYIRRKARVGSAVTLTDAQRQGIVGGTTPIKDPDNPKVKPYYGANSGDIFSISNFPYSTLEIPVQISKDDAQLNYEAKTDRIPPLTSKVWLLLEVSAEKK